MVHEKLTDLMISQSFEKTGVKQSYFPIYEAEAKRCFLALEIECPDDDDNAESSLELTDDYIKYYVEESEKGHCHKWCASVAEKSVTGGNEDGIYRDTYDSLDSVEEKERELNIHTNSLSDDPIFRERYKSMFEECLTNLKENTENYTRVYHSLIAEGKSEVYAHAYAYVSADYMPLFCEIYAEAYELGIKHGMDSSSAYCFGDFCTEACDQGYENHIDSYIKQYHEVWQKELYLKLICDKIRREDYKEIDSAYLYDIKKMLGL